MLVMLRSFADVRIVTPGNHRRRMRTLFSTGKGFFELPYECDTTITGSLFDLRAVSITYSIISLCPLCGGLNRPYVKTTDFINNIREYKCGGHSNMYESVHHEVLVTYGENNLII